VTVEAIERSNVAVLCAARSSYYFDLATDVWDARRDARLYDGNLPVVAHPPCRAFGKLRGMAKPTEVDFHLASHSVLSVQRCGGVLEHPAHSTLWAAENLPPPGYAADQFGGWTVPLLQSWFGHGAAKMTWLYVVGVSRADLPRFPLSLATADRRVENMGKAERDRTPLPMAKYLLDLALRCGEALRRDLSQKSAWPLVSTLAKTRSLGAGATW